MGRGGGCHETKTVCWSVKLQCRACGRIIFSKNVNNFLSTNPTTLILSSLVSEF